MPTRFSRQNINHKSYKDHEETAVRCRREVCLLRRVSAARRAAARLRCGPFVRTAWRADRRRAVAERLRAALLACRESAFREAVSRCSRFSAAETARERAAALRV